MLPGTVTGIAGDGRPHVDVLIDAGVPIRARITGWARRNLRIAEGSPVHAMIKAVSIDRDGG